MATEIGTLVAKFTADTAHFEAGRKRVEAGLKQTQGQAQLLTNAFSNALNRISPQMGQLADSFSTVTSAAGGLVGALGVAGIALTGTAVVTLGAAKAMYDLATSAASVSDKIGDMADKVNFSVRTISGMETAIESAGGSVEGFVTALGIFDRNIEAVAQGDERLSKLFKALKIDATDNEKAFRQVADILTKLQGTGQQTALAMELFGRSGKDVLGAIKAAGGSVEDFIKRMEALGIVIGDDAVKKADAFDKQMVLVKAQLATVTRQLGEEFIPMVQTAGSNLSNWLAKNQGEIRKTIVEIGNLIKTIGTLVNYIMSINPIVLTVKVVSMFSKLLPDTGATAQSVTNQQQRNVFTIDPVTGRRIYSGNAPYDVAGESAVAGGPGQYSVGAGPSAGGPKTDAELLSDTIRKLLARGGGGGRGGSKSDPLADMKKMAEIQLRITKEALAIEESDIENSYDKRRITISTYQRAVSRIEEERHKAVLESLTAEEKAIKESKTLTASEKKIQYQEIELKRLEEANRHRQEENRLANKILESTRERIALTETLIGLQRRLRYSSDVLVQTEDGRGQVMNEETRNATTRPRRVSDRTRARVATEAEEAAREQYQRHLDKMKQLAHDLTSIFSRAVSDGFEHGAKRGFQSLALGILDLLQNMFMKRLEEILANAFSGIGQGGKGGGLAGLGGSFILNNLPGLLTGFLGLGGVGSVGGLGTGISGAIGRATGGPIWPGQAFRVHKDETIVPMAHGLVIPNQTPNNSTGGNTYHININIPETRSADSYKSPRSRRELATQIASTLQGSLR